MNVGKRIEPVFSPPPFPPFLGKRGEAQKGKEGSHNAHMPASSSSFSSSSSSSSCGLGKGGGRPDRRKNWVIQIHSRKGGRPPAVSRQKYKGSFMLSQGKGTKKIWGNPGEFLSELIYRGGGILKRWMEFGKREE